MYRVGVSVLLVVLALLILLRTVPSSGAQVLTLRDAQLLGGASLEEIVAQSAKVARIRITKRVELHTAEVAEPCGYMYSARVVEGFKGGTKPFEFVAPTDEDFLGLDRDYLVMALPHFDMTPRIDSFLRHMLSPAEDAKVRCRMAAQYYVPGAHRMLWEIREHSGEEWLAPDTRPALAWCATEDGEAETRGIRQVRVGNSIYDAVQWRLAKSLITRALTARPYKSDGSLDPDFRPRSCQN
jgi:hypothetical protein